MSENENKLWHQQHAPRAVSGALRLSDDHHAKSHALDSAPAYFLVLVRLLLLGLFLFGAVKTFEAEQSSIRRGFIGRLVALGTLWFAAMPVLVLVAMVCAEYIQEPVSCRSCCSSCRRHCCCLCFCFYYYSVRC